MVRRTLHCGMLRGTRIPDAFLFPREQSAEISGDHDAVVRELDMRAIFGFAPLLSERQQCRS